MDVDIDFRAKLAALSNIMDAVDLVNHVERLQDDKEKLEEDLKASKSIFEQTEAEYFRRMDEVRAELQHEFDLRARFPQPIRYSTFKIYNPAQFLDL